MALSWPGDPSHFRPTNLGHLQDSSSEILPRFFMRFFLGFFLRIFLRCFGDGFVVALGSLPFPLMNLGNFQDSSPEIL